MFKDNESLTLHNENAVARISLWANIIGWTILVISLFNFSYTAYNIISNWDQIVFSLPTSALERISIFASQVFFDPLMGVFYFLVLRGVSQGLNLLLDIFYQGEDVEIEEEIVEA